jgi:hypothetical protein
MLVVYANLPDWGWLHRLTGGNIARHPERNRLE